MPDILIRGMEMPMSCAVCKIRSYNAFCPINSRIKFFYDPSNKGFDFCSGIHPDCPLLELPPHGDLIDRDASIAEMKKNDTYQNWLFRKMLGKQTVVVPAERSDPNA